MRNVITIGVVVGVSVASPAIYQKLIDQADNARSSAAAVSAPKPGVMTGNVPSSTKVARGTARIEADAKGHYSGQFKFNGRRIDALVDTGATVVAINTSTARKAGISLTSVDFDHTVSTANGEAKAAVVTIGSLEIGRIRLEDVQALVMEDKALQTTLIGMNVLNRLTRYSVEGKVLVLEQ